MCPTLHLLQLHHLPSHRLQSRHHQFHRSLFLRSLFILAPKPLHRTRMVSYLQGLVERCTTITHRLEQLLQWLFSSALSLLSTFSKQPSTRRYARVSMLHSRRSEEANLIILGILLGCHHGSCLGNCFLCDPSDFNTEPAEFRLGSCITDLHPSCTAL
jgi:hypothetical protein